MKSSKLLLFALLVLGALSPRVLAVGMRTNTAEESAEKQFKQAATRPATTRSALLNPDYPPAFAAAEKAIDSYKIASGLKMSVFAAGTAWLPNQLAFVFSIEKSA